MLQFLELVAEVQLIQRVYIELLAGFLFQNMYEIDHVFFDQYLKGCNAKRLIFWEINMEGQQENMSNFIF